MHKSHHSYMSVNLQLHQLAYQYNVTTDAILTDFLKTESAILVRVEFRRETVLDFMKGSPQELEGRIQTWEIWKFCSLRIKLVSGVLFAMRTTHG